MSKGTESRLIGWANAVDACNTVWDDFASKIDTNFVREIESLQSQIDAFASDFEGGGGATEIARLARLQQDLQACRDNFKTSFPSKREEYLDVLQRVLLKKKGNSRHLKAVASRHNKNLITGAPKKKKKRAANEKRRKHRKTGLPRGWNMRPYVHAPHRGGKRSLGVRGRRDARRFARKGFRTDHRANNIVRSLRPLKQPIGKRKFWKAYPLRRAPKKPGWREEWLSGKLP